MKKILALLMTFVMLFNFTACSNNTKDSSSSDKSSSGNNEVVVEEKITGVQITFAPSFWKKFIDESAEEYAERIKEDKTLKKVEINEDGSITISMSKEKHKQMLDEIKKELEDMFPAEEFASIKEFEFNDDLTDCKLIVDKAAFEKGFDSFAVFGIGLIVQTYHFIEGDPSQKTVIHYIDFKTKKEFDTYTIPDDMQKDFG